MRYSLIEIERFPTDIEEGILYWSQEFKMCAHRCACGCGDVIQLPVDNLNFCIVIDSGGVTVRPSIGNWNVCDAHYYITSGEIEWLPQMSQSQIAEGRAAEDGRRETFYARKLTWRVRFWAWLARARDWLIR